jgi:hypothetical protein
VQTNTVLNASDKKMQLPQCLSNSEKKNKEPRETKMSEDTVIAANMSAAEAPPQPQPQLDRLLEFAIKPHPKYTSYLILRAREGYQFPFEGPLLLESIDCNCSDCAGKKKKKRERKKEKKKASERKLEEGLAPLTQFDKCFMEPLPEENDY